MTPEPTVHLNDLSTSALQALSAERILACDTETTGLDWRENRLATVQLCGETAGPHIVRIQEIPLRLVGLLASGQQLVVFHHAMFDLRFLLSNLGVLPPRVWCTKVAGRLLNPTSPSPKLGDLSRDLLGVVLDKSRPRRDWMAPVLSAEQIHYAAMDVVVLIPLLKLLRASLSEQSLDAVAQQVFDFLPTMARLQIQGVENVFAYE